MLVLGGGVERGLPTCPIRAVGAGRLRWGRRCAYTVHKVSDRGGHRRVPTRLAGRRGQSATERALPCGLAGGLLRGESGMPLGGGSLNNIRRRRHPCPIRRSSGVDVGRCSWISLAAVARESCCRCIVQSVVADSGILRALPMRKYAMIMVGKVSGAKFGD